MTKKGTKFTEEHRRKISLANTGRMPTEETREKLRENAKIHGFQKGNTIMKGTTASAETKLKMSLSHKGKKRLPHSQETKDKISIANTGKKGCTPSQEIRDKISASRKGKYRGDKCPSWRGGISYLPYCPKFNREFKERVRAFFGYKCSNCGMTQAESVLKSKKVLAVHHVNYDKGTCCNDGKPLFVALCGTCHAKTNNSREYWEKTFAEMITQKYDGKCYLTNV